MAVISFKILFLVLLNFLLVLVSCEEQVQKGSDLSPAEREYLRRRAAEKCINSSNRTVDNFIDNTNSNMLDYEREDSWKIEYKKNDTVIETSYLYVWKVSPPTVYFLLKQSDSGTVVHKYIKIDTTNNAEMAKNIQEDNCNKTYEANLSENSLNAKIEVERFRQDADTLAETDTDYRVSSNFPLYFSSINRLLTKRTYDNDEKLTATDKFDYVFTRISDTSLPASYQDSTISNRQYCVSKYSNPTPPATLNDYPFPFTLECSTNPAAGPDANGDAVVDFDPGSEL